jgi:hypothetical protein
MFQKVGFTGTKFMQCNQELSMVLFQCSNVPAKKYKRGGAEIVRPLRRMQNQSSTKNLQKGIRSKITGTLEHWNICTYYINK